MFSFLSPIVRVFIPVHQLLMSNGPALSPAFSAVARAEAILPYFCKAPGLLPLFGLFFGFCSTSSSLPTGLEGGGGSLGCPAGLDGSEGLLGAGAGAGAGEPRTQG